MTPANQCFHGNNQQHMLTIVSMVTISDACFLLTSGTTLKKRGNIFPVKYLCNCSIQSFSVDLIVVILPLVLLNHLDLKSEYNFDLSLVKVYLCETGCKVKPVHQLSPLLIIPKIIFNNKVGKFKCLNHFCLNAIKYLR